MGIKIALIELIQHLINGLSVGSIYALIALGYTMVFGILQLINFAHGDVYMIGAFVGYYLAGVMGFGQESSLLALLFTILVSMLVCGFFGLVIERVAYRPLRNSPRTNLLITAVGVSLLLEYSGQLFFGADPKFFPQIYYPAAQWSLAGLTVNPLQVTVFLIAIALTILLEALIYKTRLGRAMRAVSFDHKIASLMGIPTNTIISMTFILGSALAGSAGVLVGLIYPKIDPLMGTLPGLKAFVAAVLGGIGNIQGAVLGALILGLAESLVVAYLAPAFRDALAFGILIVILLIRPAGLLGQSRLEKV